MQTVLVPETLHPGGLELTKRALELCSSRRGERLADLGCGSGAAVLLARREYGLMAAGFDLRLEALRDAASLPCAAQLACARAERLPLAAASCDIVLAECSLSTMGDLDAVLSECRRVLVPGGRLAITDLYCRPTSAAAGATHLNRVGPAFCLDPGQSMAKCVAPGGPPPDQTGWIVGVESAGFDVLRWEDHTPALTAWAAQSIFSGRSLASLWGCSDGSPNISAGTVSRLRLGYCLMMAQKRPRQPAAAGFQPPGPHWRCDHAG